jgi:hypothetical protein
LGQVPSEYGNKLDTKVKPTNAYKNLKLYYVITIAWLLHVTATVLAILRQKYYKEYITKTFETTHKYNTLSFKRHVLKYVLKYKIQSTECLADATTSLLLYFDGDKLLNSHIEHLLQT